MSDSPEGSPEGVADDAYRERMERKKARIDRRIARAQESRGVLLVLTGSGKGKSSSAFGMAARALGHGMRVGIVQFIKGRFETGEMAFFRRFDEVEYHIMGEGYTWETQDRERDTRAARAAWSVCERMLHDESFEILVFDELNIAIKHGYVTTSEVLAAVRARPAMQHVVITGRAAPDELIEAADTATEMRVIKHAFQAGIRAQKGIEL